MEFLHRKNMSLALGAAAGLLLIVFGAYLLGYRLLDFKLVKVGSVTLASVAAGTVVYIDGDEALRVEDGGTVTLRGITPGEHSIILGRDSYWPWSKNVVVESEENKKITPFAVPQSTNGIVIPRTNPKYDSIKEKVERSSREIPTEKSPALSSDKSAALWIEGKNVHARFIAEGETPEAYCNDSCTQPVTVFTAGESEVRQAVFYPGRNDVVLLATREGIFAIEVHKTGTQNFQPVYRGAEPIFTLSENGTLYVLDQGVLFEATL